MNGDFGTSPPNGGRPSDESAQLISHQRAWQRVRFAVIFPTPPWRRRRWARRRALGWPSCHSKARCQRIGHQGHIASLADAGEGQLTRVSRPTHRTASQVAPTHSDDASQDIASHRTSHRSSDATHGDDASRSHHSSFPDTLSNERSALRSRHDGAANAPRDRRSRRAPPRVPRVPRTIAPLLPSEPYSRSWIHLHSFNPRYQSAWVSAF